jgi:hypothetical protein
MSNVSDPARFAAAIVPSDAANINPTRGVYVGNGGDITCTIGGTSVLLVGVPSGFILPIQATRVSATGTTATSLVAFW